MSDEAMFEKKKCDRHKTQIPAVYSTHASVITVEPYIPVSNNLIDERNGLQ